MSADGDEEDNARGSREQPTLASLPEGAMMDRSGVKAASLDPSTDGELFLCVELRDTSNHLHKRGQRPNQELADAQTRGQPKGGFFCEADRAKTGQRSGRR